MDDLVKRADEVLKGVTPGPWAAGSAQWPEQVGCCPLVGRPFSVHGTDFHNVAAATTRANARFIAAARELVPAMRDRIEADAKRIAELDAQLVTCRKYRDAYAECDRVGTQALRAAEARVKVLEDEIKRLRLAVKLAKSAADEWAISRKIGSPVIESEKAGALWRAMRRLSAISYGPIQGSTLEGEK